MAINLNWRRRKTRRQLKDLHAITCNGPAGCRVGYYPEYKPLISSWHYAERNNAPAAKSIPVQVHRLASSSS